MTAPHTHVTERTTTVQYSRVRISVTQGPDEGQSRVMVSRPLRIGTSNECDLVLTDPTVSRRHCALEPIRQGIRLRDEGSTNGVLVAGVRVFEAMLTGPQQLVLGDTVVSVEPLGEVEERQQVLADRFGDLVGSSACMRELFADLARIASADVSVLIEGETGTGKELVAESIHSRSARADGPFVVFDCSAVAPGLVDSELFGHQKGAFTSAITAHAGVFEQADGGTLFLDELGELPLDVQSKLLRALESRKVRRLGGERHTSVDLRLIAATNRNLEAEVAAKTFREDLFYRVATVRVHVPPLRDRMEDLPLLARHFLSRAKPPRRLEDVPGHVWEMFRRHTWPGNVRELNNAVQRLLVTPDRPLGSHRARPSEPAPEQQSPAPRLDPLPVARREAIDAFERSYVTAVMQAAGGSTKRAADLAQVKRQSIEKLLHKHGLR